MRAIYTEYDDDKELFHCHELKMRAYVLFLKLWRKNQFNDSDIIIPNIIHSFDNYMFSLCPKILIFKTLNSLF